MVDNASMQRRFSSMFTSPPDILQRDMLFPFSQNTAEPGRLFFSIMQSQDAVGKSLIVQYRSGTIPEAQRDERDLILWNLLHRTLGASIQHSCKGYSVSLRTILMTP